MNILVVYVCLIEMCIVKIPTISSTPFEASRSSCGGEGEGKSTYVLGWGLLFCRSNFSRANEELHIVKVNYIISSLIEILRYSQKNLTTYLIG